MADPQVPIVQTFQALFGQTQSLPYGDGQRVPFEFSSTLRELKDQLAAATEAGLSRTETEGAFALQGFNISVDELLTVLARYAPENVQPYVQTLVNPRSIKWTQPKRIQRKDVRNGTVFFHFTDDNGQDNDVLKLQLSGTTGNIDLRADNFPLAGTQDVGARRKLAIFQNLYVLTREPRIIPPNIVNEMSIRYRTKAFPSGIDFFGFFDQVLEFEETGEKPNSLEWSMMFTVQRTEPDLNDIITSTLALQEQNVTPDPDRDSLLFEGISG